MEGERRISKQAPFLHAKRFAKTTYAFPGSNIACRSGTHAQCTCMMQISWLDNLRVDRLHCGHKFFLLCIILQAYARMLMPTPAIALLRSCLSHGLLTAFEQPRHALSIKSSMASCSLYSAGTSDQLLNSARHTPEKGSNHLVLCAGPIRC